MKGGSNRCSGPLIPVSACFELSVLCGKHSDAVDHHKDPVAGNDIFKSQNINHLFSLRPNQSGLNSCPSACTEN